ncbi:ATP-binding protein [Sansalvadorimonas verongulae]|uniref:ATP-binding protein n=1 Tax=Sansalvadorimonas verongulae TaxID=2172824 RepID=UPI0012BC7FD9|nr:ATP-binding protein [Sansalvadorimonas verongulae]MTI15038.1 HAMP domain-containing protein [Sansalvadorimonas verongulae]
MSRFWPSNLAAQMVMGVLLSLVIAQILTAIVLFDAHRENMYNSAQWQQVKRTTKLVRELAKTPAFYHQTMVKAASMPRSQYTINLRPLLPEKENRSSLKYMLVRRIERSIGPEFQGHVRVHMETSTWRTRNYWGGTCSEEDENDDGSPCTKSSKHHGQRDHEHETNFIVMSVQLPNKTWLNLRAEAPISEPLAAQQTVLFLLIASALVMVAIVFIVQRITRPLKRLSNASNRLGRGEDVKPLPMTGPEDIQRATRAFNQMNERINRFVADRTSMLAALTHDLRTPMTTMRLRIELLPDSSQKDHLLDTLDEMQQMAEATLSFARESSIKEPSRRVELNALVDSICEDLRDIGMPVEFTEGLEAVSVCRPVSLRRALRNLIENGVKYGKSAEVSLLLSKNATTIVINDNGPGMDEKDMERVFEPFVRLEQSRNRDTGGIGLGMAIARNIIHAHGGKIHLANRPEGGLQIQVALPL